MDDRRIRVWYKTKKCRKEERESNKKKMEGVENKKGGPSSALPILAPTIIQVRYLQNISVGHGIY
jgi:hypothetical protein